jgi:hypothetical protein
MTACPHCGVHPANGHLLTCPVVAARPVVAAPPPAAATVPAPSD